MWLKSLRRVPLGPFTMTVRPFRVMSTRREHTGQASERGGERSTDVTKQKHLVSYHSRGCRPSDCWEWSSSYNTNRWGKAGAGPPVTELPCPEFHSYRRPAGKHPGEVTGGSTPRRLPPLPGLPGATPKRLSRDPAPPGEPLSGRRHPGKVEGRGYAKKPGTELESQCRQAPMGPNRPEEQPR